MAAPLALLALLLVVVDTAGAAPATLSRDVGDYFALSFRRMRLKDFYVEAPGCNLGVNCQETGRSCGRLQANGAVVHEPGQIVGDDMCGPGSFYEVFRNNTSASCSPNCGMVTNDGPGPNCENTFGSPILGDLDNDGQPSCDDECEIDIGDVAAACGVPYPLPACDPARPVRGYPKSDCLPVELDVAPGNRQCDLAPGVYGEIRVRNKGRINFGAGTTVACMLAVGKATRVTSAGTALVLIPGTGKAAFNNLSDVGGDCRSFKVVTEFGPVRFAKHGEFHLDACSLGGTMKLGHDNNLRGRFISGEFLVSNFNSTGGCCEPTTTTTSTSTSTTSSSSTTTSSTIPQVPGICCEDTSEEPPLCLSAETESECRSAGGTPGPAGTLCEAAPAGGGRCGTDETPGGCCQHIDSCAIGGGIDEAACAEAGGAFVPEAVCTPDGLCEGVGICCEDADGQPPICGSAGTEDDCLAQGGTPGAPGSTCEGAPGGGGQCDDGNDPGGCCQLADACTIGVVDEIACSSLGGAFVADATCSTGGDCVPATTTTTLMTTTTSTSTSTSSSSSSTSSTSTSTSTSSSTSSTSSTSTSTSTSSTTSTVPGPGVCCEFTTSTPSICSSASSGAACTAAGGTPGQPGDLCHLGPNGGVCDDEPPPPDGGCCELADQCVVGNLDAVACTSLGGAFVENAACLSDGRCVTITTTSTTTSSTTSSSSTVTSVSSTVSTVSTSSTSSTTSSTLPGHGFTRTIGFYKTHPGVTQWILDQAGGITICGVELTNTDYDDAQSALEALCISPKGDQRLQLVRQLTAAGLTMAAGGATYADFAACDALCESGGGSIYDGGDCINSADAFNNSGDNLPAPFDGIESGYPEFCQVAHKTTCNVLEPATCAN